MKHSLRVGLVVCCAVLFSAVAIAGPRWPPLAWGHERTFYDANGNATGGFVACHDYTYSWGTYTDSYQDTPYNCP